MSQPKTHRCLHSLLLGITVLLVITVAGFLQAYDSHIIVDTHEHIDSAELADLLAKASQTSGIQKTVLLATPTETLTLNGQKSFTGYRENMEVLLQIQEAHPERFVLFCTVNPLDSDVMEYLQDCVKKGGSGIKLYNGHTYYYDVFGMPLDSKRMTPIYAFAERNHLPVLFHVNITKYGEELVKVLNEFPDLVVSIPHFMVSSIDLERVTKLLDQHPNLYTDISFGSPEFMAAGFRRISADTAKYANFINAHHDRILFGADIVLTGSDGKNQAFIEESLTCYRNLLEKRYFECPQVLAYYEKELNDSQLRFDSCEPKDGDYCQSLQNSLKTKRQRVADVTRLHGLHLSAAVLNQIYWENPNRFLNANQ